jgi:hypothetical protein
VSFWAVNRSRVRFLAPAYNGPEISVFSSSVTKHDSQTKHFQEILSSDIWSLVKSILLLWLPKVSSPTVMNVFHWSQMKQSATSHPIYSISLLVLHLRLGLCSRNNIVSWSFLSENCIAMLVVKVVVLLIKGTTLLWLSPIGYSEISLCTHTQIVCGDANCTSCPTAPFCEEDNSTGQLT